MAKGKRAFGISSLIKKDKNQTADWPEIEDEFLAPSSDQFINRRPPLDPRIEQELKQACALILQDLKPSGYDIEDTRMKSDILVDEELRDGGHYLSSRVVKPKKTAVDQSSAKRDSLSSHEAIFNDRTHSFSSQSRATAVPNRAHSLTAAVSHPAEGPLAPVPTTVNTASPANKASRIFNANSSRLSSLRASDIQSSGRQSSGRQSSEQPSRSKSFFSSLRPRSKSKSGPGFESIFRSDVAPDMALEQAPLPTSAQQQKLQQHLEGPRTVGTNFSRPSSSRGFTTDSVTPKDYPARASSRLETSYTPTATMTATAMNGIGHPFIKDSRDIKDKSEEPLSNPRAKHPRSDSLTSSSVPRIQHGIFKSQPSASSQSAANGSSAVNGTTAANGSSSRTQSITSAKATDYEKLVRATAAADAKGKAPSTNYDQRPGTSASNASKTTLPADSIPQRISSRSQSMLQPPVNLDQFAKKNAMPDRSFSMNAASMSGVSLRNERQRTVQLPEETTAEGDDDEADAVSLRDSDGPTSLYELGLKKSMKERRGLSKLLYKLGGGDMPVRRKIYIPPHYGYHAYASQQHQEDDDYWDEEACAAPVVGFGRGW